MSANLFRADFSTKALAERLNKARTELWQQPAVADASLRSFQANLDFARPDEVLSDIGAIFESQDTAGIVRGSRLEPQDSLRAATASQQLMLPIEDESMSKEISLELVGDTVRELGANDDYLFAEEFDFIKTVGVSQSVNASRMECNRQKNRYTNILAYDHSRVILPPREDANDYINANFINVSLCLAPHMFQSFM